ncbi:hypothetical protein KR084_010066, partial [Drosophila pseudotakahashii]
LLVRNERAMLRVFLWALLVVPSWSKIYKYQINSKTQKWRRWWEGPGSSTGRNFGGWLFYISHAQSGLGPICGASYYAPYLMIASANCIHPYRYDLEGTSVEPTFSADEIYVLIENVYTPPRFLFSKPYMDIAVIYLQDYVKGKTTEFIKLCNTTIVPGMHMTSYGWGFDSIEDGPQTTDVKNGSVRVEDSKSCLRKYSDTPIRFSSTNFCVTHPRDKRKCRYDGGSPLTHGRELCGVVSTGPRCSYTDQPGIYTNINKVTDFILDIEKKI